MKITIQIDTHNAAFEDNPSELEDLLTLVAKSVGSDGKTEGRLHDTNGNPVGNYKVQGK